MPELPEVETVVRGLCPVLVGRTILGAEVRWPGVVRVAGEPASAEAFQARLANRRIAAVRRRAKLLIIDLVDSPPQSEGGSNAPLAGAGGRNDGSEPAASSAPAPVIAPASGANHAPDAACPTAAAAPVQHLVFHLKMTGNLFVTPAFDPNAPKAKHVHLLLPLDDGNRLAFRDMRKFGYASAFSPDELADWAFMRSLGPEPLELAESDFVDRFSGRSGRIKALLLDQSMIAGVGNIYADESLHRAAIRPDAKASDIDRPRLRKLWKSLRQVLTEAIAASGSSIRDYRQASGEPGGFQSNFRVYGKKGEPCPKCGRPLVSAKVAGRTSTYCEICQKG